MPSDGTERAYDHAGADQAYAAAFAKFGLDVAVLPPKEIARRIQASAIRDQLVTALDYWAYIKERLPGGDGTPLRGIAQLADTDTWRQQLRDPKVATNREALERLAEQDGVLDRAPANLLILSFLLDRANGSAAAVSLLRRAQQRHPTDFWINFELGLKLAWEQETAAEAVSYFRAALVVQPDSPVVYLNLANAIGTQGLEHENGAQAAVRKAIALKPDYAEAYRYMGNGLLGQRKYSEAVAAFQKAIDLQPNNSAAYSNLVKTLWEQSKCPEEDAALGKVIDRLEKSLAQSKSKLGLDHYDTLVIMNNLAQSYRAVGRLPEAIALLEQTLEGAKAKLGLDDVR